MPSEPEKPRRRHPLSLLFSLGSSARSLLIPGLAVLVFSRGSNLDALVMVFFLPAAAWSLIDYLSFSYQLTGDELILERALVFRKERHIPYMRIQNIDLRQNPFHRLFRVCEVKIETAAGEEPEATIRVLGIEAMEEMRRQVFARRQERPAAGADAAALAPASREILRVPPRELALVGLVSSRGLAIALGIVGALWPMTWYLNLPLPGARALLQAYLSLWAHARGSPVGVVLLLAAAAFALSLLLRPLSMMWTVIKLHDFRLLRQGADLRTSWGLLTREAATIPLHRIQLLAINESLLLRWFRRLTVLSETAGSNPADASVSGRWLAPVLERKDLSGLLREVQPEVDLEAAAWRPVSKGAARRIFRRSVTVLSLVAGGLAVQAAVLNAALPTTFTFTALSILPLGILPLALVPLIYVNSRKQASGIGYAFTESALLFRRGWWTRDLKVVRYTKIQALSMKRSPFDRRYGMARIAVDTAGSGAHQAQIPYLDDAVAREVFDRLGFEASRTDFRW